MESESKLERQRQASEPVGEPGPGPERKPTILDVAKRAKVALGTASRVINGQPNVREDKRKRVQAAIAELGYVPDIVARSMRSHRSMTFACVMRDFTVPVLSMFVDSMQKEIDASGFSLMVASSYHDARREIALMRGFQQRRIDGLVIATSSETDPLLLETLEQMDFPIVLIDREMPAGLDAVAVNHAAGMCQAVSYLADIGHRRIAFISGEPDVHPTQSRLEGFRLGLQSRGLSCPQEWVRLSSFGTDMGHAEAKRLLDRGDRPTALIAGGSALLPGVIRATRELGLSIPRDVSVIAGADSDVAQLAAPAFTVVRWSHDQLGKAAGRFLIDRLAQPSLPRQRLSVDAELVVRGSCAAPAS
ncbi:LacI family DNA-binding transcriptional regulator [uncultured Azohydromonas sp.]|jgi:Transcriptional regulators|uniref:LacI family DNA-binding transcriptional regulator n=1 Tax=uncultured Azohydromonas sp. TaxID=487342 RepID=UPI0026368413|nr:LacI family DNA-binding transcriptional regulator [uncultured Azohydromonas sp.]